MTDKHCVSVNELITEEARRANSVLVLMINSVELIPFPEVMLFTSSRE